MKKPLDRKKDIPRQDRVNSKMKVNSDNKETCR